MAEDQQENPSATITATTTLSVALIVGVTGITGLSLAEALRSPSVPGGSWTVYGAARRPPPSWFPLAALDGFIQLDALDAASVHRALFPIAPRVTHLFWVAVAANADDTAAANAAMLSNVLSSLAAGTRCSHLRHVALQTGTMHYLPPLPAGLQRPAAPVPFREDVPRGSHPLFYYALEDLLGSHTPRLTWTVHRPSVILGASPRSEYNLVLTLAAYALICRQERAPLVYPGNEYTWKNPCCDASDADMLAEQQIWAAASPAAGNEAFNCTNGDVFAWRSVWEVFAGEFGVEHVAAGSGEGWEWVERMKRKGDVWDNIVEEEELVRTRLDEIANFEYVYVITNFEFEIVSCMKKSREFGFDRGLDTMESLRKWIRRLREMKLISY